MTDPSSLDFPKLEVTWDTHDPAATKWKYICRFIGHQWQPSHPHYTYCNRCGMGGDQHYVKGREYNPTPSVPNGDKNV